MLGDAEKFKMDNIMEGIGFLRYIYDAVRLVDPVTKKVYEMDESLKECKSSCYEFWNTGQVCKNCVSMRAIKENKTFIKVEYNGEKVYMVTVVPVQVGNRIFVAELLKEASDSNLVEEFLGKGQSEIYEILERKNMMLVRDELTKIFNRRYINERLPYEIMQASLKGEEISIIMADIDKFKNINDTYGHIAGDKVLQAFAGVLEGCIRKELDWAARYGGEEFIVFLKAAGYEKAHEVAERMRKATEGIAVDYEERTIRFTSSFGVCTLNKSLGMERLIAAADKNLYTAKNTGRNKVVSSEYEGGDFD